MVTRDGEKLFGITTLTTHTFQDRLKSTRNLYSDYHDRLEEEEGKKGIMRKRERKKRRMKNVKTKKRKKVPRSFREGKREDIDC